MKSEDWVKATSAASVLGIDVHNKNRCSRKQQPISPIDTRRLFPAVVSLRIVFDSAVRISILGMINKR